MTSDTKTALLDVAEHAARARGFDGFSYADLAEAVGIRKASIHYHFPTKAALSAALMHRYHQTLETACNRILSEHQTGAHQLLALIELYRDALNDGKTLCLCISLIGSRESLSEDVVRKIRTFRTMMVEKIETILKLGQEDKSISGIIDHVAEAHAVLALLEGAHLSARAEENVATFDEALCVLKYRCRLETE